MNSTTYLLFVSCAPGLEELLGRELLELGHASERKEGGVELRVTLEGLERIALGSALAEGLRVRLRSFVARDFGALVAGVGRLPWRAYLRPEQMVRVRVSCHRSKLWHTGAVEERVLGVLQARAGVKPYEVQVGPPGGAPPDSSEIETEGDESRDESDDAVEGPATVFVRITGDAVQLSVDAAGRLHRRGYRTHVETASLRETLAASLVRVAEEAHGSDLPSAIWDPFCGAGTLVCEAARRFAGIVPGGARRFPFQDWPTHDAAAFAARRAEFAGDVRVMRTALAVPVGAPQTPIDCIGSDISTAAIAAAQHNAELGGVSPSTRFLVGDFLDLAAQIPQGAWLISNPPYGERLVQRGLMQKLDQLLRRRRDLRPAVVLVGGSAKKELPAQWRNALTTKNGGLDVSVRILER